MRSMSIYRSEETNQPPTAEEMSRMGKLIEEETRKGVLIARVVGGDGESEVRQMFEGEKCGA